MTKFVPKFGNICFKSMFSGICVIINNRDFYQIMGDQKSKSLPTREGTEIDCGTLFFNFFFFE